MAEHRQDLIAVEVTYLCDKCGESMVWNGSELDYHPKYPHACINHHTKHLPIQYPYIDYKPMGGCLGLY